MKTAKVVKVAPTGANPLGREFATPEISVRKIQVADSGAVTIRGRMEVLVEGKLVFTTPKESSMSMSAAAQWYREQAVNIGKVLKDASMSPQLKARTAYKLRQMQFEAAKKALSETDMASEFASRYPIGTFESFVNDAIQNRRLSGSDVFEDVVNSISRERDKIRYPDKTGGCLVKRTLVHTREGLRPIEQIKIGDYVLSSPEDGSGGAEYKRVVKTFVHTNRVIAAFLWWGAEDGGIYRVAGTPNHPFWVEGVGWTRGDCLNPDDEIRSINGGAVEVNRCQQIYRTKLPGVGWRSALSRDDEGAWGGCFNYEECMQFDDPTEQYLYLDPEIENSENPYLAVTVYNIEVEDFHTYYVHPHGVWVHNTNCDERIELSNGDGVLPEPDRLF